MTQHRKLAFHFLVAAFWLAGGATVQAQSGSAVYGRVAPSIGIVLVSTFEGQPVGSGSAVTVGSQTMVTNRHVLPPGYRYHVLINGTRHEAYPGICDSTQDLCLLNVQGLESPPVEFADMDKVRVGDVVYAVGAPGEFGVANAVAGYTNQKGGTTLQLTLSNGLVTVLRPVEDGKIIQTNAAISPGSSGGGLFDSQGRLVGITTFQMARGQNLNMALPVNWVQRLGVTGAPRSTESAAVNEFSPTPSYRAPQESTDNLPVVRETENVTVIREQGKSAEVDAPSLMDKLQFKPWWGGALGGLLLLWFFMRRRDEVEYSSPNALYIPPPPPPAANPQLKAFIEKAAEEFDNKQTDEILLKQVWLEHKGNKEAVREAYIEKRANRLLSIEKDRQWAAIAQQNRAQ